MTIWRYGADQLWHTRGKPDYDPMTPADIPPIPRFSVVTTGLDIVVDGTASTDPDGVIYSTLWDFGDGGTASGATAAHTYSFAGTYTVLMTVIDDRNVSAVLSQSVTVSTPEPPNMPPVANLTVTSNYLQVTANGSASADPDGTIASWSIDFGDGAKASTSTASHTYAKAGTYTVKLIVTDNDGVSSTTSKSITVTARPPVATFTKSTSDLTVSLQSTSIAGDYPIVDTAWNFGDGVTASGLSTSTTHTYTSGGTYKITLTVKDSSGVTASTSTTVTVVAPGGSGVTVADNGDGTLTLSGPGVTDNGDGTLTLNGSNVSVDDTAGTITITS